MGRKDHPVGFRIGIIRDWQARWYADKQYAEFLREDLKLRQAIQSRYNEAGISLVEIDRQATEVSVTMSVLTWTMESEHGRKRSWTTNESEPLRDLLAQEGIRLRYGVTVFALQAVAGGWSVREVSAAAGGPLWRAHPS